jgi:hypothetical protein
MLPAVILRFAKIKATRGGKSMSDFISLGISFMVLLLLALLGFGGLQWLNVPVGSLLDWVIGGAIFWWLVVIVTVPWNIYFQAKQTLAEAEASAERGITVQHRQVQYVAKLARRSLWAAIALHGLSAIGLYSLAAWGISAVGYIGSGAALLLTGLRPAVGAYQYFALRMIAMRQEWTYPREDIVELRQRLTSLEETVARLNQEMDPDRGFSWMATQQQALKDLRRELAQIGAALTEEAETNQREHDRLSREAQQAIAQLTTDGQFLDHVREIIRFFKTA